MTYGPLTSTGVRRRRRQWLLGWLLTSGLGSGASWPTASLPGWIAVRLGTGPRLVRRFQAGVGLHVPRSRGVRGIGVCLVVAVGFR